MSQKEFICFRDIGFRYRAGESTPSWILQNFNLNINRAEVYVLLGPSGCGKTTALNLLAGFEQPETGVVSVAGEAISSPGVDRVVIFQGDDSLFGWLTASENVEFGLKIAGVPKRRRRALASQQLEFVGLKGQGEKFPMELSGGMKQRIQIARALVCESPILLMDEPFAALDAQTRAILQDELTGIQNKIKSTILFITHDIAEAITLADRIGIMSAGPDARVKRELEVQMERPRRRGDPEFGRMYDEIHEVLSSEVRKVLYSQ